MPLGSVPRAGLAPWVVQSTTGEMADPKRLSRTHSGTMSRRITSVESVNEVHRSGGAIPCAEFDADLWFAERPEQVELAKTLCGQCPLRQECLAGALERGEPWGVWGGQLVVEGAIVARKRGRGRPRKDAAA